MRRLFKLYKIPFTLKYFYKPYVLTPDNFGSKKMILFLLFVYASTS